MQILKKAFYRIWLSCLGLRIGKQYDPKLSRKIDLAIFNLENCGGKPWT